MFKVRSAYGALGVMLTLIAIYLVLERATGFSTVVKAVGGSTVDVFKTLQGR